jgi:hypothetical protein
MKALKKLDMKGTMNDFETDTDILTVVSMQ